jgi:hypothetical protein
MYSVLSQEKFSPVMSDESSEYGWALMAIRIHILPRGRND